MNQKFIKEYTKKCINKANGDVVRVFVIKYTTPYSNGSMIVDYEVYTNFIKDFKKAFKEVDIISIEETHMRKFINGKGECYYEEVFENE